MKKSVATSVFGTSALAVAILAGGLTSPASAADEKYFVTIDTVGMCSVIRDVPGTGLSAGKEAIANTDGYATMDDAKAALAEIKDDKCEGVVVG